MLAEGKYKIEKEVGVLSESRTGWTKELNLISWNGYAAKYDLRTWGPERSSISKGITITLEEMRKLHTLIGKELMRIDAERMRTFGIGE